jgi:hypothetical protein
MPNICDDGQLPDEDQRVVIYETYCLDWPAFLALNYRFYDFQENFTPMHRILHHYCTLEFGKSATNNMRTAYLHFRIRERLALSRVYFTLT